MPAVSKVQQRLAGADLQRKREGKPTRTGMTAAELRELAKTRRRRLPERVGQRVEKVRRVGQ